MLKKLADLSDERLLYYLARIRQIAAHDDQAALIETDKLAWELADEDPDNFEHSQYERIDTLPANSPADEGGAAGPDELGDYLDIPRRIRNRLSSFQYCFRSFLRALEDGTVTDSATATMRSYQFRLAGVADSEVSARDREELETLRSKVDTLLERAATCQIEKAIERAMTRRLISITSVQGVHYDLDQAIDTVAQDAPGLMTPVLAMRIRQGRKRVASFRAQRKLERAEIADAGNSKAKAASLRGEATALLALDWADAFPVEYPPAL